MEHGIHIATHSTDLDRLMVGRDTRWYKGHLLRLTIIIGLALITSMTNGFDGSVMNGLQTLETWRGYFGDPKGGTLGLFNAIQSIGGIAGLPFAPYVADMAGRRTGIFTGSVLMLIGVALQTAAQNIGMFIGARFLIGFGLTFAATAAPLLITELAYPTHRAPLTSLYNSSWYLGSIVAAWTTYGTFRIENNWSWRIPSVLQGLPSLIQLFLIYTIPESPRWNIDHGRDDAAIAFLVKHHCNGDADDPLVAFEYNEIKAAIALEKEAKDNSSWKSLFATPGNRRRMRIIIAIAFFSQWSGNGLVSYYLNKVLNGIGIKDTETQTLINGILQIYNYITAIIGALVVDKAGRRTLFLVSTAGMTVSFSIWTACSAVYAQSAELVDANDEPINPNKHAGNAVIAMIALFYGFYNIALSPHLVSYTVEILPFRIRAKGLVVMNLAVNCSLVFNQYVNPIAMEAIEWKYYLVYCVWLAFEFAFIFFFLVETLGKNGPLPLEEIAAIFDKDEKAWKIRSTAAQAVEVEVAEGSTGTPVNEKGDTKWSSEHVESAPVATQRY